MLMLIAMSSTINVSALMNRCGQFEEVSTGEMLVWSPDQQCQNTEEIPVTYLTFSLKPLADPRVMRRCALCTGCLMPVPMSECWLCWQPVTTCSQDKQIPRPSHTWLVPLGTLCSIIPIVFHSTSMLLRHAAVLRPCLCSSTWRQTRFTALLTLLLLVTSFIC